MWAARANLAPRTKFPPPTTTATWAPVSWASLTSWAMRASSSGSMPDEPGAQKASPLSLRRTRRYGVWLLSGPVGVDMRFPSDGGCFLEREGEEVRPIEWGG